MQSKHYVFAALITLLSAGAVIAAIVGLSQPISTANSVPNYAITSTTETPEVVPQAAEQTETATDSAPLPLPMNSSTTSSQNDISSSTNPS